MTDEEIIKNHDVSARPRARMELKIVDLVLLLARNEGFKLSIDASEYDGNEVVDGVEFAGRNGPTKDIRDALFNLDDVHLFLEKAGEKASWVYFVFGNSGFDLISDYTTNLEEFLKPVEQLADRLENGLA